jgi:hypothetical protein
VSRAAERSAVVERMRGTKQLMPTPTAA